MGFHHLVVFDGTGEKNSIDYSLIRGEIWAVAVHPSGKYLFVVGDNFIDTLDAETLEPINAMLLGGKLRDVAVSPDGKRLYVADAVWRRVRIIPSPIREF
jgi:DNA-binding beta-propeller fold protein YncE